MQGQPNPIASPRMQLVFASGNPHKLEEVAAILSDRLAAIGAELVGLDSLHADIPEPEEDQDTFEGNARIKAAAYARATARWCLADDSGLEVDALNGAPGVHSARYAGVGSTRAERDNANNAKLLAALREIPSDQRLARFVCVMALADPSGDIRAVTRGTFEGVITDLPRGMNGFGYDPLLYLPDDGCTSAELALEEKNARSHRGAAARLMLPHIMRFLSPGAAQHAGRPTDS